MGAGESCHCSCNDVPTSPTKGNLANAKSMSFDDSREEVSDPIDSCKSWDDYATLKQKPVLPEPGSSQGCVTLEQKPSRGTESPQKKPAPLRSPSGCKRGWRGIDEERYLSFRLFPSDCIGLDLVEASSSIASGTRVLVVANVEGRSAFAKTEDGQPGICAGDVIVQVNGRRGNAGVLREVLQEAISSASGGHFFHGHINIVARPRASAFDAEMLREGAFWDTLGITLVIDKTNPRCALVQSLSSEGLVPDWNKTHASLRVCVGDLISHVNDFNGDDAAAMFEEIQRGSKGSVLRFHVVTSVAGQAAARRVTCKGVRRSSRMCARSPESVSTDSASSEDSGAPARATAPVKSCADADARTEAQASARGKEGVKFHAATVARVEVELEEQPLTFDATPWSVDRCDTMEEIPPPLMSPAHGAAHQECDDAVSDGSSDVEEKNLRNMLQFALDTNGGCAGFTDELRCELTREHCLSDCEDNQLEIPWGDASGGIVDVRRCGEEHVMSDASTDFPSSGTATPALGVSYPPHMHTLAQGCTTLWV